MNLKQELKELATHLGADLFGIAPATCLANAPKGHKAEDILPGARSIIVLAMKMLDTQVDILPVTGQETAFFGESSRQAMYAAHGGLVSRHLDDFGFQLARFLEKEGYQTYHQMASAGGVDARYLMGLISLKHAAVGGGLGVIGHSSLLITPQFGPRIRLTAIITDAELEPDKPLVLNFCKDCPQPCITECPADALTVPQDHEILYELNKFACNQYLNTRPACAVCLKVCPSGNPKNEVTIRTKSSNE
ncbi:MAG: hypothetical protein ACE5R6_16970 [Candidatus Heimdallarchaeota archaeon]